MGKVNKYETWQLLQLRTLPLEEKINYSNRRIREFYEYFNGDVKVSFSGGLDSTVLLHLVRSLFPDVKAIFCNTGLEYPENIQFVNQVSNLIVVRPTVNFVDVVEKYGYPIISKEVSEKIEHYRNTKSEIYKQSLRFGKHGKLDKTRLPIKYRWLIKTDYKISSKCCDILKKDPFKNYSNLIIGSRTDEGRLRERAWLKNGCTYYNSIQPKTLPLAIWTSEDIKNYIQIFNLNYSKLYDIGYQRSGCYGCLFGLHLETRPNRFDLMKTTHPKLFDFLMDGKLNYRKILKIVYNIDI